MGEVVMRKGFLAGTALGVLVSGAAQAQVQAPGVYGFAVGSFLVNGGKRDYAFQSLEPSLGTRDAIGGRLQVGYRFESPIDVAIAAQGAAFRRDRPKFVFAERLSADYVALDLEVGYTFDLGGAGLRAAVGPRYVDFRHAYSESGDRLAMKYKAIGPRAALSATGRLGNSEVSLFGDVSGSVLFGRLSEAGGGDDIPQHRTARSRTAINAEAQAGIAWEPVPQVSIAAGIRFEAWWGVNDTRAGFPVGIDQRGNRIGVGPFIRLAYNWGAPLGPVGQPPPINGASFIIFFDFDRADLTASGLRTIKEAVRHFKAGHGTRVTATGHADRAGPDAHNQALSLRRANVVKDQLVREGVPAGQIVIVGKGESQPLVPTADGVREPQNRRVEIVFY